MNITVIGGGLAGCEAAYAAALRGANVTLYEMKPNKFSPAHSLPFLCELVCSNSLKADRLDSASGLLKREMRHFSSVVLDSAEETSVPAGGALAVDRELFAKAVTDKINSMENIRVINEEVTEIPKDGTVIIACGPLVDGAMAEEIKKLTGGYLSFFDAAAPILTYDSIDMTSAFKASRYDRGDDDYINCPMNEEEYNAFYDNLVSAERAPIHESIDKLHFFEGCMPVEVMAKRGRDTIRFGPLKPVGLTDPHTGRRPYANVQLRCDNKDKTLYNIVGFQTNLKFSEQKRVFSMIPALKNAEFVRYGVMHRNLFLDSPSLLNDDFSMKGNERIYFAGQMTGVEGYIESAMSGMIAGMSAAGKRYDFPRETIMGALTKYISGDSTGTFQPMNANFGILPPLPERIRDKKERYTKLAERSLEIIEKL
ncbi:MAG: methylenetetrahydrofolate--tRNA-(uracil(54)-C(5))-methyltransferase (FADH(2)-oxidizing) TrmFO [Clostridia bacterium]|nr:methylenetetrahydrofolate--tRNA-(uracil(54)-C(5))-methyltransferase (FADH(2)-oxidizing) TrmFO [Clostridia bacterium]